MSYSHKINKLAIATLDLSAVYDEAWSVLDAMTVKKTEDYGECPLCGATLYYCIDYTHEDDCPISVVERMHDLMQDALKILDHEIAQKLIEAGKEHELRPHPLEVMERQMFDKYVANLQGGSAQGVKQLAVKSRRRKT